MSKDYRLPENRAEYFTALYKMNLEYGVMPGLVYLYMPKLAEHFGWDTEQKLWFAFLNGNTQHPITSLRLFQQCPELPAAPGETQKLVDFFNGNWDTLSFDTDRRYGKRDFPKALESYIRMVDNYGSQENLLTGEFSELWDRVANGYYSFGRLATFSYLEYVKIMGAGAACDNLFLDDKSGSKSHRNGLFFLLGYDDLVWDKRQPNSHDGSYDLKKVAPWLTTKANEYLRGCGIDHPDIGYFTFESQCCAFKNGFFGRRYPGVYSDMALDRIKWYDDRGFLDLTKVFKDIRAGYLPEWLREECEISPVDRKVKAFRFKNTGTPFRAENFMEET